MELYRNRHKAAERAKERGRNNEAPPQPLGRDGAVADALSASIRLWSEVGGAVAVPAAVLALVACIVVAGIKGARAELQRADTEDRTVVVPCERA